jgi:DMSO/TMAO reductase YedYZ molybdopterin-dependent catalytic subunit
MATSQMRTGKAAIREKGERAMKKTTAIIFAIIAIVLIIAAAFSSYYTVQNTTTPQKTSFLPAGEPPQDQIRVTGDFAQEKTWTIKELSQMPLTNVTIKGETDNYTGVTLIEFCNQTNLNWDAGPLNIIGATGNSATLSVFQAWNSTYYPYYYNNNVIVLAFIKNGQWMNSQAGGPIKLVAPYFSPEYQVQNVAEINSIPWTITVSGDVANPIVITGKNLTCVQPKTVHAEFRPGGETNRTSDWTGLPIMDVLQAANMLDRAEKITIVAIDGYAKNYTLDQVRDGQMMIGYRENGQSLPTAQGGPFRLFAPTDQYKWGQYWVKFIREIIVS